MSAAFSDRSAGRRGATPSWLACLARLTSLACLVCCAAPGTAEDLAPPRYIARAVAHPARTAADRARDAGSRPAQVLAFLGLRPGMRVLDLNAATGYYTEILARAVGPKGRVIAHNHPGAVAMLGPDAIGRRYEHGRLPNVTPLLARHHELGLPPASLDFVLMSMTYHDTYWYDPEVDWGPVDQLAFLGQIYGALAPGGAVGVIDHVAGADTDPARTAKALHRIDPEVVKRDFRRAGFILEADSDLLRNPQDDHQRSVFDAAIQGRTDRFVLRFRKPAGWTLPAGVPPPRVPAEAPMTPARVELGRHLFYDRRLSGNGTQACATCHIQSLAFTDGRARPVGSTGEMHPRSAMSLINVAYRDSLTWADPRLTVLETQLRVPLLGQTPVELGLAGHEARVFRALARDATYRRLFADAFPGRRDPIDTRNVTLALAAFMRSIVSFRSPFDRFRFANDEGALSPAAKRGWRLFFSSKARCGGCYMAQNVTVDLGLNLDGGSKTVNSPATEPPVFMYHNTGVHHDAAGGPGLGAHTLDPADVGRFRVPSLRNVAVTAPYMHDGSIATLDAVLDHYVAGGRDPDPRRLSESIRPLQLSADERADLIAFLQSLTDEAALGDPRWSDPWTSRADAQARACRIPACAKAPPSSGSGSTPSQRPKISAYTPRKSTE